MATHRKAIHFSGEDERDCRFMQIRQTSLTLEAICQLNFIDTVLTITILNAPSFDTDTLSFSGALAHAV